MSKTVFAIAAHPDDIEFMMSGTLFQLKEVGCDIHYMNIANGCCGTDKYDIDEITKIRRQEGIDACKYLGATYHESLVDDLGILYDNKIISQLCSRIREVQPDIILTQYPNDYMEDHSNAARVTVTAAFCRGMKNYAVEPHVEPYGKKVTLYHSLPYGLVDPLKRPVDADFYIDVEKYIDDKVNMLAMHKSQKDWLDVSQGQDSYLVSLRDLTAKMGEKSGKFKYAEGWIRHLHLGFCDENDDPLCNVLVNFS